VAERGGGGEGPSSAVRHRRILQGGRGKRIPAMGPGVSVEGPGNERTKITSGRWITFICGKRKVCKKISGWETKRKLGGGAREKWGRNCDWKTQR